jgi:hypothetical protein
MRIVKQLGLVLVAVCAFSALAVSSASASPVFLSHPLGLLLASTGGSTQVLNPGGKAAAVECTAVKLLPPGDTTTALISLTILVVVDYEKCKVGGILAAVVHPVRFLIDANGLVKLENDVLVLATEGCVVTIPAARNQGLWTIKFENTPGNNGILLLSAVTRITASGVGGPEKLCEFAESAEGKYTGNIHVKLDSNPPGGVIRWDP